MKLIAAGVDFQKTSLDVRAQVASATQKHVRELCQAAGEYIFLNTCNRVEIYAVTDLSSEEWGARWRKVIEQDFKLGGDVLWAVEGSQALRHLFRVTSSLESMVVGESQILGQVKRAYEDGIERNEVGPKLHSAFQAAFRVAKKIRSQTEVGRLAVSIPSLAVKLSEKILGDLSGRSVLILGLGEIGRVAAEHFASVTPKELLLYNRTRETAEKLHRELTEANVKSRVVDDPSQAAQKAQVIVHAADAKILTENDIYNLEKRGGSFLLVDLAVPSHLPRVPLSEGYLYTIDDLKQVAEDNHHLRRQELVKAENVLEEEVRLQLRAEQALPVQEVIAHLAAKTDSIAENELKALKQKLAHLSDQDWAEVERTTKRIGAKILQDPMLELKSQAKASGELDGIIQMFRSFFRI